MELHGVESVATEKHRHAAKLKKSVSDSQPLWAHTSNGIFSILSSSSLFLEVQVPRVQVQSSLFLEFNGNYSIYSPDVTNMPTSNTRTAINNDMFNFNRWWNDFANTFGQTRQRGEYKDSEGRTKNSNDDLIESTKYCSMNQPGWLRTFSIELLSDLMTKLEDGTALLLLDNVSWHSFDFTKFKNNNVEFLCVNMTGYIQLALKKKRRISLRDILR